MEAACATPGRSGVAHMVTRPEWSDDIVWQDRAECKRADANLFFTPSYLERKEDREARELLAKSVCAHCPVRAACLNFALSTREAHGVWGGTGEIERRHIMERRAG